ncbi:hypothetical protein HPB47_018384 [Ixodes persulcatus]|uniref:Uncharacterized protein n=1 Tax=Ixodes persulcatus TaxID=34615 RepID=A0AC60QN54_IXOPE|nr:hypothetical protein HPB47_018384 [Ixodes persulcatus]
MQRALRMNDGQLLSLSEKALHDNCLRGYLCKRTADSARWQLRWFVLYQNLLFYYESDSAAKPSGVLFLEGSYCERLLTPVTGKNTGSTQVSSGLFSVDVSRVSSQVFNGVSSGVSCCASCWMFPGVSFWVSSHGCPPVWRPRVYSELLVFSGLQDRQQVARGLESRLAS